MFTPAQRDAAFKAARLWVDQQAGWYAAMIPDADVELIVNDILAAGSEGAAFTAARARINALAGWYAAMIPDADVQTLCRITTDAAAVAVAQSTTCASKES